MAGEGRLAVRVLGGVDLTVDGRPVDLGGALPRAIIAHLAIDCGRVVSVERLIDRLWGDDPPRTPLGTLQSYVSRLRRAIEPVHGAGQAPRVLVSEAPGYRLVVERSAVDAHRFVDLAERARQLLEAGDAAGAMATTDEALDLWRGEPLAGLGPDDQIRPIVVPLDERHDATVELRFEAQLLLGHHTAAVPALQAAAEQAPLRERRWGLLAQALYRDGRQADALRALATAREHLVEQLGLDPGPELRELERRILAQDPALLHAPPAPAAFATPAPAPRPGVAAPPAKSLVGRQREWQQLAATLDSAAAGTAQLVLLEGEPGIGKSTLCDAVVKAAAERGWRTAVGRCVEAGLAPTLWPAVEIVRSLVRDSDTTTPAISANPLFRFVVEQVTPAAAPTSVELVDQFVELLDSIGSEPLLVVLDDLHWADRATLDVVTVAAQRLGTRPVVVLAAFRPPELVPGTLLAEALGRFRRLPAVTSVTVAPLATDEVAELMTQTAGAAPSADVAAHVRERTGGNPLFVTELSRLAGERGVADASAVPAGIRDVVRERLAQLPERATAELEVAAIVGERFTLRTVIAASDRSADACLDALDAAIVTRILVPDGDDYRFAHALVRDAVLADLSPMRRERLHAAVADAIVAVYGEGGDVAEPVAYHRLAARTILDPLDVAEAAVRAADVARWKNALDQSEELSEATLSVLAGAPRSPRARKAEVGAIEALIAVIYRRGGDVPHEQLAERVAAIAAHSRSESAEALALFLRFGRIDEVEDLRSLEPLIAQVRALAERTVEPYAVVTVRYMLSSWALLLGHVDEAVREAALGYEASGAPGPDDQPDHVPLVMLPFIAGIASALAGDAAIAHEHIDRRMRAWLALRSEVDHAAAHNVSFSSAFVDALLGDANAVYRHAQRYVPVGNHGVFPEQDLLFDVFATWASARVTGTTDMERGHAALATLEAGTEIVLHAALRAFLAEAQMLCGDGDAADLLRVARAQATARREVWWLAEIVRLQALAADGAGDHERAIELIDEAREIATDQGATLLVERIAATSRELRAAGTVP